MAATCAGTSVALHLSARAGGRRAAGGCAKKAITALRQGQKEPLPAEPLPAEALPAEALPAEALPVDALPADALPAEALPAEPLPVEPVPEEPQLEHLEKLEPEDRPQQVAWGAGEDGTGGQPTPVEADSEDRVAKSLELLSHYSTENHPGHQPGRFVGQGPEHGGMKWDGKRWYFEEEDLGEAEESTALAKLSEADRALATKFEAEGGFALLLSNAFTIPDILREKAKGLLQAAGEKTGDLDSLAQLDEPTRSAMESAGMGPALAALGDSASPVERAVVYYQAADMLEEREAVMRNVWSDVEFSTGEEGNAELVARLERQFAAQLVRSAEVRLDARKAEEEAEKAWSEEGGQAMGDDLIDQAMKAEQVEQVSSPETAVGEEAPAAPPASPAEPEPRAKKDGIFELALRDCSDAGALAQKLPEHELNAMLLEPRNLGVALDLVGVYLKNYEIDKADLVITRAVPLCRQKGGTWLVKGLDKLSAVRMKQFRAYDSLVALKEIEQIVPFAPNEGWEFHDILYRNLAWCYSALDEPERCLAYTRKSVEVKRASGVPASWFDIWDLGKGHARLGQKTNSRDEMEVAYDLCAKACEIHRKAEANDRIMLAKILANMGEVALGVGDNFHINGDEEAARNWYTKAEPSLVEAYELQGTSLGPMKPLTGWAAGTVAHCMVRLRRWEDARDYLTQAFKVECRKDSTTPGSVIELLDRVLAVQQQLNDLRGMGVFVDDLDHCIASLRGRGWEPRERDVFALLLHKAATAFLVADDGTGKMIDKALEALRAAETNLNIFMSASQSQEPQKQERGKVYDDEGEELKAAPEPQEPNATESAPKKGDGVDVPAKRFGPRADPEVLLQQVTSNIKILSMAKRTQPPADAPVPTEEELLKEEEMRLLREEELREEEMRLAEEMAAKSSLGSEAFPGYTGSQSSTQRALERDADLQAELMNAPSEPEEPAVALARHYALVGNWSNWRSFHELERSPVGEGTSFFGEVDLPAGHVAEFQVICDRDWKRRLFPAGAGGGGVLGPSSGGHGRNWRVKVPVTGAPSYRMRVELKPSGQRSLSCTLEALAMPVGGA